MDRDVSNELGRANYKIGRHVVLAARARASSAPNAKQAAKASKSARAYNRRDAVEVALGGRAGYAFALGAEFGSIQYAQFPRWTGNQWTSDPGDVGYWFHPAIDAERPYVMEQYLAAVRAAALKAGVPMQGVGALSDAGVIARVAL